MQDTPTEPLQRLRRNWLYSVHRAGAERLDDSAQGGCVEALDALGAMIRVGTVEGITIEDRTDQWHAWSSGGWRHGLDDKARRFTILVIVATKDELAA